MDGAGLKDRLRARAVEIGFHELGIARAEPLESERARLREWLARGHSGSMSYLDRLEAERLDPEALLPGARSVVCVTHNYGTGDRDAAGRDEGRRNDRGTEREGSRPFIARYARGRDYHRVLQKKLRTLARAIEEGAPDARTRVCVDTAPLLEKAWAERAGLGWRGKHTNLVVRSLGSWSFLGEILTDVELPPDEPHLDFCGSCTRCLDACPTRAFPEPYVLDARRCISYLTIEHRGAFGAGDGAHIAEHLFGCDICLEACPWNSFQAPAGEPDFEAREAIVATPVEAWASMSEAEYDRLLAGSAMRRARHEGLVRNARQILDNRKEKAGA